jgi:erythronate-4-phosphate dehydrogenase
LSSMEEVLRADVIAMHAPLTRDGDYPSYHQMGATELVKLKSGQLLINAGRGATLDNAALLQRLQQAEAPDVLLDVWEGEPEVSRELLKQVELGTPHVAGYSYDGKCRATQMLFEQISEHFSVGSTSADKPLETSLIPVDLPTTLRGAALLRAAINQVYDLRRDDSNLREALVEEESSAKSFDRLRRCYPERHEFSAYSFRESQIKDSADVCLLKGAGFRCLP